MNFDNLGKNTVHIHLSRPQHPALTYLSHLAGNCGSLELIYARLSQQTTPCNRETAKEKHTFKKLDEVKSNCKMFECVYRGIDTILASTL
jgi:hypothetical protein